MKTLEVIEEIIKETEGKSTLEGGDKEHLLRVRVALYFYLSEFFSASEFINYLKEYPSLLEELGLPSIPNKTTIEEWLNEEEEIHKKIELVHQRYLQLDQSEWMTTKKQPYIDKEKGVLFLP